MRWPCQPEVLQITNRRKPDGLPMGFEEAGRYWHSDMSYLERPVSKALSLLRFACSLCTGAAAKQVMASVMYARTIPSTGGDTLFADMYRAYATLDAATATRIETLSGTHLSAGLCKSTELSAPDPFVSSDRF